uniref:Uncharacterized protein n=1 Tax=Octopus bimaculoides TaxID=37653 RepID=A0A0L8HZ77_OCTBM
MVKMFYALFLFFKTKLPCFISQICHWETHGTERSCCCCHPKDIYKIISLGV